MGLEAYRIEFETINPTNRADILDIFANIGFQSWAKTLVIFT